MWLRGFLRVGDEVLINGLLDPFMGGFRGGM